MLRPTITILGFSLLAAALVLEGCTGTVPGYEPQQMARYRPPPAPEPTPEPRYEPLDRHAQSPEPTPRPSYARESDWRATPPARAEESTLSRPSREAETVSPRMVSPSPSRQAPSAPLPGRDLSGREQRLAILTDAVVTLRRELSESYQYSEELEQERDRLQAQVEQLRKELADSQSENSRLRNRLEELERRLDEISPPHHEGEPAG